MPWLSTKARDLKAHAEAKLAAQQQQKGPNSKQKMFGDKYT